jgi:hypothetical protein
MANSYRYFVELRNSPGTTLGTHVTAHSSNSSLALAAEQNPSWRPLSARRIT